MRYSVTNQKPNRRIPETFDFRRYRAALVLRNASVEGIARIARVTSRQIWFCLQKQRNPSAQVFAAILQTVGENGWRFAIGQTDTLRDEESAHAPA